MGESPRWHDGRFWMCDWLAGEVLVFDADANRKVVARVEGRLSFYLTISHPKHALLFFGLAVLALIGGWFSTGDTLKR